MSTVCLQGGNEFSAACAPMDAELLRRAEGPVVVSALAGAPGRDYRTATENGVRHFRSLGAAEVLAAPDAREDQAAALELLRRARLLVLPGGSPARLLAALRSTGVDAVVEEVLAAGGLVTGSSAGAMVLCPWTVLPEQQGDPVLAAGLGVVPGLLVVPHWTGAAGRESWLRAARSGPPLEVLGLPEESGVMVEDGTLTAVGRRPVQLVGAGRELEPGQSWRLS